MRVLILLLLSGFTLAGCAHGYVQEYWPAASARSGIPEADLRAVGAIAEERHKMRIADFRKESSDTIGVLLIDGYVPSRGIIATFRKIDGRWEEVSSDERWASKDQTPNQALEPTATAVTPPAAQEPRQP
jgi:hypothetical protein